MWGINRVYYDFNILFQNIFKIGCSLYYFKQIMKKNVRPDVGMDSIPFCLPCVNNIE